jgi:hypothetical protein
MDQNKVQRFVAKRGIASVETLCNALQEEFYASERIPKQEGAKRLGARRLPDTGQPFSEKDGTINSTMKIVRYKVSSCIKKAGVFLHQGRFARL